MGSSSSSNICCAILDRSRTLSASRCRAGRLKGSKSTAPGQLTDPGDTQNRNRTEQAQISFTHSDASSVSGSFAPQTRTEARRHVQRGPRHEGYPKSTPAPAVPSLWGTGGQIKNKRIKQIKR